MRTNKLLLTILSSIMVVSCSTTDNYSWEQEDDDPSYVEQYYPGIEQIKIHTIEHVTGKDTYYYLDVEEGMDLSPYLSVINTEYDNQYLLGIYLDKDYKRLIRRSDIISYHYNFDSLFYRWERKEVENHYLNRYYDIFLNAWGDEMNISNKGIVFDYSVNDDCILHIECKDIIMNENESPYTNSIYINGKEMRGTGSLFRIENNFVYYDGKVDAYGTDLSILKTSFIFNNFSIFNVYLESVDSPYRINELDLNDTLLKCMYTSDNKTTIRFDK